MYLEKYNKILINVQNPVVLLLILHKNNHKLFITQKIY